MKHRLPVVLFAAFIAFYLCFLLYFLTIRPGGAAGNPQIMWALTSFASGGTVMMAVFSFVFYLFRRTEKAFVYFSLLCISSGIRFLTMERSLTLMELMQGLPYSVNATIRIFAMSAAIAGLSLFIFEMFGAANQKKHIFILNGVMFALACVVAVSNFSASDEPIHVFRLAHLTFWICGLIIFFYCGIAVFKRRRDNKFNVLYLFALSAYILITPSIALFPNNVPHLAIFSNTLLILAHAVLLSDRYGRTISEKEHLEKLNRTKDEFWHNMAHNILTPLTTISTSVQVARQVPEEAGRLLEESQGTIMEMSVMIKKALEEAEGDNL